MNQSEPARRGSGQSPTDTRLLSRPLDFISEDHQRERQICAVIVALAGGASFDRQDAAKILRFLNEELNVHLRDETEDLFPLLVRRCNADDAIDTAIARIKVDQDQSVILMPAIRSTLSRCLDTGSQLTREERAMLTRFAGHVRRHVVAENAILLPIARARLTRSDLERLSHRMRSRRGLKPLQEENDA